MSLVSDRVLLVEPNQSAAETLGELLVGAGIDVAVAQGCAEALRALAGARFDAIVTARQLPDGTSTELLDRLFADERFRHAPVLVLAGRDQVDDMIEAISRGAADFMLTPINDVLFLARLRAMLERKRMADRERDYLRLVDLERRRAELLLYDLLPADIAARLKRGEAVIADAHDHVTVLFADLVGFTTYANGRAPQEVVAVLDALFSRFDELATSYGVEKIKTIGDGYMAASGLPAARDDHAAAAADLALAMREIVRAFRAADGSTFQLRIGLASGPVVAGVIGARRHVYDLWDDTVNIASRMESTAPADGIQLAPSCRDALGSNFRWSERGMVEIKGKAPMATALLVGRGAGARAAKRAAFARTARFEARQALENAERATTEMQLVDATSGLLSARGFMPLCEAAWRSAQREQRAVLMLAIECEGDETEVGQLTQALRATFRDTDLLTRWDDRTFAMLGLERTPTDPNVLRQRLEERLRINLGGVPEKLRMRAVRLLPSAGETEHRLVQFLTQGGAADVREGQRQVVIPDLES